jgi:hypothetical protein
MCLVGAAAEPGCRMESAELVGVRGRGMRGGRSDCLGWGTSQKQANGVSKALLRQVNRERSEMAYRGCGVRRPKNHRALVSSHLELSRQ